MLVRNQGVQSGQQTVMTVLLPVRIGADQDNPGAQRQIGVAAYFGKGRFPDNCDKLPLKVGLHMFGMIQDYRSPLQPLEDSQLVYLRESKGVPLVAEKLCLQVHGIDVTDIYFRVGTILARAGAVDFVGDHPPPGSRLAGQENRRQIIAEPPDCPHDLAGQGRFGQSNLSTFVHGRFFRQGRRFRIRKKRGVQVVPGACTAFLCFCQGSCVIMIRNAQTAGQGDAELTRYDIVFQQHRVESIGIETQQGEVGKSSDVEAVAAAGQQGGFAEVTACADTTDDYLAAARDIHGQLRFPFGDDVESAVVIVLPVDVPALFDLEPIGGIENFLDHCRIETLEQCGLEQAQPECIVFEHGM